MSIIKYTIIKYNVTYNYNYSHTKICKLCIENEFRKFKKLINICTAYI